MASSTPLPFEVHAALIEDMKFCQEILQLEEYLVLLERRDQQ